MIQLLSENYSAVAQTVNLLAEWLIQMGRYPSGCKFLSGCLDWIHHCLEEKATSSCCLVCYYIYMTFLLTCNLLVRLQV